MAQTLPIVDAHYAAYAAQDVDAVLSTLAPDFVCGPLNGKPWVASREAARQLYARVVVEHPMARTTVHNHAVVAGTVVKRETTLPATPSEPHVEALAIYTVRDGLIVRLDMAQAPGEEARGLALAQAQLDAYNAQDLDAHCACFADDVIVADLNGAITYSGMPAYRARYADVFATYPHNHAELVNRLWLNGVVIDHERVRRAPDAAPFEVLAIYTLAGDKIGRVDFVR